MSRYNDIDPQDIDPDTGRPYPNYSSPSLDMSMHDAEMDVGDIDIEDAATSEEVMALVKRMQQPGYHVLTADLDMLRRAAKTIDDR